MATALAFDIYGTLIDTHGVVARLQLLVGEQAAQFSRVWREKQLEYSFRRGLMQCYENFDVCTQQALEYTCQLLKFSLSAEVKSELMALYRKLPAFDDVATGLEMAKGFGFYRYAFSNGLKSSVEALLVNAGIIHQFDAVVSVDQQQTFKPNPLVYKALAGNMPQPGGSIWLVSSNPFDVIGAISAGLKAAWIQRQADAVFDPWGIEPTLVASTLPNAIQAINKSQ
ncbi:haloacid dehalogenase type II [Halioxenophilus sp. WMMB6]|uniref:haloacid dehalogenase type II n=1 Tax=Halioxenophilus sp. WMMB6 TaxID=3073815 RepID=UPI00295EAF40|nr:haloacid dehalogenase type II [Halioxenophilus sp. WMMB6]